MELLVGDSWIFGYELLATVVDYYYFTHLLIYLRGAL